MNEQELRKQARSVELEKHIAMQRLLHQDIPPSPHLSGVELLYEKYAMGNPCVSTALKLWESKPDVSLEQALVLLIKSLVEQNTYMESINEVINDWLNRHASSDNAFLCILDIVREYHDKNQVKHVLADQTMTEEWAREIARKEIYRLVKASALHE